MVLFRHRFVAAWGIALCLSVVAQAAPAGPASLVSVRATVAQPDELTAAIAGRIAPILPDGARLDGVTLGCNPPANATLQDVAPGVTRLTSRGVVIELREGNHTIACSATVAAERQVLVAAHDFDGGASVTATDVQPQWVDAFTGAPNALDQPPGPGLVTAGPIRAGQPLYAWQLIRPIAIHPGDRVTVVIRNGPVTLRALLEANSSAAVGESATVINPDTDTPVAVTVTGPKTAELVMP
jgi:flagella basal body P-ring formation protein FlgA